VRGVRAASAPPRRRRYGFGGVVVSGLPLEAPGRVELPLVVSLDVVSPLVELPIDEPPADEPDEPDMPPAPLLVEPAVPPIEPFFDEPPIDPRADSDVMPPVEPALSLDAPASADRDELPFPPGSDAACWWCC
jgi:hypothetical protein